MGTLTIQGNLTVSETGVITLHVLGGTAALQDRLVVTGTAALHGQIGAQFRQRLCAAKQGDQLALIQASAVIGTPQAVILSGLEEGFDYELTMAGGIVTLTAMNDGVATTQRLVQPVFLPLVQQSTW